jgi:hypothetical protein
MVPISRGDSTGGGRRVRWIKLRTSSLGRQKRAEDVRTKTMESLERSLGRQSTWLRTSKSSFGRCTELDVERGVWSCPDRMGAIAREA